MLMARIIDNLDPAKCEDLLMFRPQRISKRGGMTNANPL
jgi:hypothetical protein